jgi:Lon protease-like protein
LEPGTEFEIPVMPVTHTVLFPGAVVPLMVFEEADTALVDAACREGEQRFVVAYWKPDEVIERVPPVDSIGTVAQIIQHKRAPTGDLQLMVQGITRVRITGWTHVEPYPLARAFVVPDVEPADPEPWKDQVLAKFDEFLALCQGDVAGMRSSLTRVPTLGMTVDMALACLPVDPDRRQKLLEVQGAEARAQGLLELVDDHLHEIGLAEKLRPKPDDDVSLN